MTSTGSYSGWDWRRRLEDTVGFFFNKFLPRFKSLVQPKCGDVLQDYVLIGHSFGGMVVTLMLHQYNALLSTMGRADNGGLAVFTAMTVKFIAGLKANLC